MATVRRPSVFAPFEGRPDDGRRPVPAGDRRLRWVVDSLVPLGLAITAGIAVLLPESLGADARLALFAFAVAVILWSTTGLNAAYVALSAVLLLVLTGGSSQDVLFESLASDVIWLMIGAFVVGGAVEATGLAARMTQFVVGRAASVRGVFFLLAGVLMLLSLLIPSTSGRAAVTLPVFRSIAQAGGDRGMTRALALMMPSVILVTTVATLIGAGSHLVAIDLLERISGTSISFGAWAVYGVPFGIVAGFLTCWVVMRMFLDGEGRRRVLRVPVEQRGRLSRGEWTTVIVVLSMVALWLTEAAHGYEIATVTVVGALALTVPGAGVLGWKAGVKAVSWNLIIFVGAALALGRALIETGAAQWLIGRVFAATGIATTDSTLLVLLLLAFITLTSHLYITSHVARAAALVPPVLYLADTLSLDAAAVLFISTVGMDYCLTLPVSSKALLMFQELDEETYQPSDLLRLSAVMLVLHVVLVVAFYYGYWRWVGLSL
jgi:anion transporter